ncbi:MAG: ParB/RepB/Spo0J family partition protein [Gammaproteobacteria bacterium]
MNRSAIVNEKLLEIDPQQCVPWIYHNRHEGWLNPERLDGLINSIKKDGQLQPGLVRKTTDEMHPYEIIFGVRRWSACIALGRKFRARITTADDRNCLRLMHFENEESRNISPLEKAFAYADQLKLGLFRTQMEFADDMNITVRHLSRLLRIASLRENEAVVNLLFKYVDQLSLRMVEEVAKSVNEIGFEKAEHIAATVNDRLESGDAISLQRALSALTQKREKNSEKRSSKKTYLKQSGKTLIQASRKTGEIKITLRHGIESSEDVGDVIKQILQDCRDGTF